MAGFESLLTGATGLTAGLLAVLIALMTGYLYTGIAYRSLERQLDEAMGVAKEAVKINARLLPIVERLERRQIEGP